MNRVLRWICESKCRRPGEKRIFPTDTLPESSLSSLMSCSSLGQRQFLHTFLQDTHTGSHAHRCTHRQRRPHTHTVYNVSIQCKGAFQLYNSQIAHSGSLQTVHWLKYTIQCGIGNDNQHKRVEHNKGDAMCYMAIRTVVYTSRSGGRIQDKHLHTSDKDFLHQPHVSANPERNNQDRKYRIFVIVLRLNNTLTCIDASKRSAIYSIIVYWARNK